MVYHIIISRNYNFKIRSNMILVDIIRNYFSVRTQYIFQSRRICSKYVSKYMQFFFNPKLHEWNLNILDCGKNVTLLFVILCPFAWPFLWLLKRLIIEAYFLYRPSLTVLVLPAVILRNWSSADWHYWKIVKSIVIFFKINLRPICNPK